MEDKVIRLRMPTHLYKRYKVICIKKDLSLPKQTADLIRQFVDHLEEEIRIKEQIIWNGKKTI